MFRNKDLIKNSDFNSLEEIDYSNQWVYIPHIYELFGIQTSNANKMIDRINRAIKKHDKTKKENDVIIFEDIYYPKDIDEDIKFEIEYKVFDKINRELNYIYSIDFEILEYIFKDGECVIKDEKPVIYKELKCIRYKIILKNKYLSKIKSIKPFDLITNSYEDEVVHNIWHTANLKIIDCNLNGLENDGIDIEFELHTPKDFDKGYDFYRDNSRRINHYDRLCVKSKTRNDNFLILVARIKNKKFRPKARNIFEKLIYKIDDLIKN